MAPGKAGDDSQRRRIQFASADWRRAVTNFSEGNGMKAAVFVPGRAAKGEFVEVRDVARPVAGPGQILLRVSACGVCRTDLHIVEGDLPQLKTDLIPGHQIVGEVIGGATPELPLGTRVGVSWMGGVDGSCWFCTHGMEN